MHYVELVERFDERGRIEPYNKLDEVAKSHHGELYRSVYLFDESIIGYVNETGSVARFDGIVYPDRVYLDFDGDTALNYMRASLLELEEKGVYEGFQVFFSGTGFHIELDSRLFNFEPTPNLPIVVRNTIREIFPDVDNIFDKTRIIRYRNTINIKSGLYKIPLTVVEAQTLTIDQIKELAAQPRWDFKYDDVAVENKLQKYVVTDTPQTPYENKIQVTGQFPCINNMLLSEPSSGSRHDILMRLTSHFKRHGYPQRMTFAVLNQWLENDSEFQSGKRRNEIIKVINDVYSWDGFYTCKDRVMQDWCDHSCPHYHDDSMNVMDLDSMNRELERRTSGKLFSFDLKDLWPEMKYSYRIEQNELVAINGAPGMGKSAFAQNLVIKAKLKTLYCSFEMPSYLVHRRNLQIVSGLGKHEVLWHFKQLATEHWDKLRHIYVHTEAIFANQLIKLIEFIQPKIIVLDHILLMKSQYRDEYAKVSEITQTLRQISIKYDIIILMISQVSRENARSRAGLDIHSGKGSGSIENDASKVLIFERESRTKDEVHIHSAKDREGQSLNGLFEYNTESLQIGRYKREVFQQ